MQKRQEPEVKADREVASAAIQHTVEFTAPRVSVLHSEGLAEMMYDQRQRL
jgi:hypothetical protein